MVVGCQAPPSYEIRWEVTPRLGEPLEPLDPPNANECTRVGVVEVEVTAWNALGLVQDRRRYPCFPRNFQDPDNTQAGPTIAPGQYQLVVRGVRRNGVGWTSDLVDPDRNDDGDEDLFLPPRCEEGPGGAQCEPGFLSCDCRFIEVVEDQTVVIRNFVLDPPPECEDGIDGDADGLIDSADPGCMNGSGESDDIAEVQVRIQPSLLGHNPNVLCSGVGVAFFSVSIDGNEVVRPECTLDPIFFTRALESGEHLLEVVALGADEQPLTHPEMHAFEVPEGGGGFVDTQVDFGDADFLQPIVASTTVPLSFQSGGDLPPRGCAPLVGSLTLDQVRIETFDARGEPLADPLVLDDGTPLDGTAFACPPAVLRTETLDWGGYLVAVEALSPQGDVCFATQALQPLAPGQTRSFEIPRVEPIPASCRDCDVDADCAGGQCDNGVCI